MRAWAVRPQEEAYLLNPAFCCTILTAAISEYVNVASEGVPFPLSFMMLPIVLHKATRESLPRDVRTTMAAWLHDHASARVLFYERLISLKPHTGEALRFGMSHNWIFHSSGALLVNTLGRSGVRRAVHNLSDEARECVMRARFLGRWFAVGGTAETVMAFWGVNP